MKVKTVTRYVYKGIEHKSLKDLKEYVHNIIGEEVLDKIVRVCPPEKHRDLFKLLDVLCLPEVRKVLIDCYNINIVEEDENGEEVEFNVLDYKS